MISIIVPCYNESESLPLFYDEYLKLKNILSDEVFELLLIDDGSRDGTLTVMKT